jgi:hypothetical protein
MQRARLEFVALAVVVGVLAAHEAAAQCRQRCSDDCFAKNDPCFKTCQRTDPGGALNCAQRCYAAVDTCYAACMQPPQPVVPKAAARNWRVAAPPPAAAAREAAPRDFVCKTCR